MTVHIGPVTASSADAILAIQRAAYVVEAQRNGAVMLPPLAETVAEIAADLELALGAWDGSRLVGSVRGHVSGARMEIARLAVAPDMQGQGIGRRLLSAVEEARPAAVSLLWLITGARSDGNVRMYLNAGYAQVGTGVDALGVAIVRLEKKVISRSG